jgi:hypothetical protein
MLFQIVFSNRPIIHLKKSAVAIHGYESSEVIQPIRLSASSLWHNASEVKNHMEFYILVIIGSDGVS